MKQKTLILFSATVVFFLGFYLSDTLVLSKKPQQITRLQREIETLNEKLISAEILAAKLDRVYTLFERNLALSKLDSLAEDASMPFLNSITEMLNTLDIRLISIQPKRGLIDKEYVKTPYELKVECNWEQFGKLLAELERSDRLITVEEFSMRNPVEQLKNLQNLEKLMTQQYEIKLTTLTLIKQKRS